MLKKSESIFLIKLIIGISKAIDFKFEKDLEGKLFIQIPFFAVTIGFDKI